MKCWLANFSSTPCRGPLVSAHLIPQQLIKRTVTTLLRDDHTIERGRRAKVVESWCRDRRSCVPACGGLTGVSGHHGELDHSRTLRVPRRALPPDVEAFAKDLGLEWWLDREYGPRR